MQTQEASSKKIRNELELIRERADRIVGKAELYEELLGVGEDGDLYDALRNVSGALQLAITALEAAGETVIAALEQDGDRQDGDKTYEPAPPGITPPPWA